MERHCARGNHDGPRDSHNTTLRLSGLLVPHGECSPRHHGFGRYPGRNHVFGRPLHHGPRQHREACHGGCGNKPPGRARSGWYPCCHPAAACFSRERLNPGEMGWSGGWTNPRRAAPPGGRYSMHQMSGSARIPSLDGLRALSISLVIFAHLCGTTDWPFSQGTLSATRNLGALGVRVFFVISGFLICQQLIDESQAQGTVSLRRFWLRRSLRIFPPAFAFIGVMCTLNHTARFLEPGDLTAAVTYTMNYHRQHAWQLGHLWSLSVEEQFYLTWPLVALAGVTHMRFCALVTIILGPFMRLLVSQYY